MGRQVPSRSHRWLPAPLRAAGRSCNTDPLSANHQKPNSEHSYPPLLILRDMRGLFFLVAFGNTFRCIICTPLSVLYPSFTVFFPTTLARVLWSQVVLAIAMCRGYSYIFHTLICTAHVSRTSPYTKKNYSGLGFGL